MIFNLWISHVCLVRLSNKQIILTCSDVLTHTYCAISLFLAVTVIHYIIINSRFFIWHKLNNVSFLWICKTIHRSDNLLLIPQTFKRDYLSLPICGLECFCTTWFKSCSIIVKLFGTNFFVWFIARIMFSGEGIRIALTSFNIDKKIVYHSLATAG